jgi:hypothetical protein
MSYFQKQSGVHKFGVVVDPCARRASFVPFSQTTMNDSESYTDIWNQAFKTYQEQTGRKIQNDSQLKKLRSASDLLKEIESRGKAFGSFRAKHKKLWSVLSSCLKPLDLLGRTLQDAVTSAPFAPAVFASVLHLVSVRFPSTPFRRQTNETSARHATMYPTPMIGLRDSLWS